MTSIKRPTKSKAKVPATCMLIGTYFGKKCNECPLGYNRKNSCPELGKASNE